MPYDPATATELLGQWNGELISLLEPLVQACPEDVGFEVAYGSLSLPEEQRLPFLMAACGLLFRLGLVVFDADDIRVPTQSAQLALASIVEFLRAQTNTWSPGDVDHAFAKSVTRALEKCREAKAAAVSQEPLNERHIANVIVKAFLIRRWKRREVYLHVYHPGWQQYHLVGLARRGGGPTDEQLARKAVEHHLGIAAEALTFQRLPHEDELGCTELSESTGARTKYWFRLYSVSDLRVEVPKKSVLREQDHRYRWFTLEEMSAGMGRDGERIIPCTGRIAAMSNLQGLPINAKRPQDARKRVTLWYELSYRTTARQILVLSGVTALALAAGLMRFYLPVLTTNNPLLANLSAVFSFVAGIPAVGAMLYRIFRNA